MDEVFVPKLLSCFNTISHCFINLEKAADKDMFVLFDENYETTLRRWSDVRIRKCRWFPQSRGKHYY
jgi:hypothetical protein